MMPNRQMDMPASYILDVRDKLIDWMAEYLMRSGKKGFVLGLSGGVDSSVLALLARDAAAREGKSLLALSLPIDNDHYDEFKARQICQQFGIDYRVIDLKSVFDLWRDILPETVGCPVVHTNLKARSRETVLYYIANSADLLVLGTVNKGEFTIGYFPKNATAGDLLPLGDLLKREVRELGRVYGVPEHVVTAKASGCIWAKTAEEEWGFTEEELDEMVGALEQSGVDGVSRLKHVRAEAKERFLKLHAESVHKRVFYPIFKVPGP